MIQKALTRSRGTSLAVFLALLFTMGCGSILPAPTQPKSRFSLASLTGHYTYSLGGTIFGLPNGYGLYHEAGSFVADGKGGLTGVDDFTSGTSLVSGSMTGSYTINGDGTGTMSLKLPGRQIQLALEVVSAGQIYLLEVDSFAAGDGGAFAQTSPVTLSGAYAFRFYSHAVGGASSTAVGRIIVTGTSITGDEDVAQIGTASSHTFIGTLTQPDSNGRGTLNLNDDTGNSSNYVYYVIDSNTLNFVRSDPGVVGEGRGVAQTGAPFTNASIQNGFTFRLGGDTQKYLGGLGIIGAFTADGKGNITSGSLDSIVDGALTNESFTGTYSVDSRGRATMDLTSAGASPISAVAWLANSTQAFWIAPAQNSVTAGSLTLQQGGPYSASSLNGEYAFRLLGFNGQNPTSVGAVGVMTFDGNTKVNFTDFIVSLGGQQTQNGGVGGSYTVSPNGRVVTGPISGVTNSMILYLTSNTSAYFLLADPGTEVAGQTSLQAPQ